MKDLQLFKLVDAISSTVVSDTTASGVRTVRLHLTDKASKVSEITINGTLCESFSIASSYVIDVVLPTVHSTTPIEELEFLILSSEKTALPGSYELLYDIGKVPRVIDGTEYLLQKWVRFLMMTPGTDRNDVSAGVGLINLAGEATPTNLKQMKGRVARIHSDCKNQIISRQLQSRSRAAPSELLYDARLVGVGLDANSKLVVKTVLIDGNRQMINAAMSV